MTGESPEYWNGQFSIVLADILQEIPQDNWPWCSLGISPPNRSQSRPCLFSEICRDLAWVTRHRAQACRQEDNVSRRASKGLLTQFPWTGNPQVPLYEKQTDQCSRINMADWDKFGLQNSDIVNARLPNSGLRYVNLYKAQMRVARRIIPGAAKPGQTF